MADLSKFVTAPVFPSLLRKTAVELKTAEKPGVKNNTMTLLYKKIYIIMYRYIYPGVVVLGL